MTEPPINSVEALERRIDDLAIVYVAVAKDRERMTLLERARELNRLTDRIIRLDARLDRARQARDTADVLLDLAETPVEEETGA